MDRKWEEFWKKLDGNIARFGVAVQGVFATDDTAPNFAYTIGNYQKGMPELFMAGLDVENLHVILNDATRLMQDGSLRVADRETTPALAKGYETAFRLVEHSLVNTELNILAHYCKRKGIAMPPVYQLVWPDPGHLFPWDQGFNESFRKHQPVLYRDVLH
jgi:Domain of unknown function (DUF4262)